MNQRLSLRLGATLFAASLAIVLMGASLRADVIEQILVKVNGEMFTKSDLETRQVAALRQSGKVDPAAFEAIVTQINTGKPPLNPDQINLLGRFNAAIGATMDGAFELADQQYRNASKVLAGIFAILLAISAGALLDGVHSWADVLSYPDIGKALMAGVIAVPLAPVAKDLTSSLQAAVTAMKAVKS